MAARKELSGLAVLNSLTLDGNDVFTTGAQVLAALLPVDGAGTGLDADLLDGQHASVFALLSGAAFTGTINAPTVRVGGVDVWHPGNDGSGSGLDADTLDGDHAAAFAKLTGAVFTGAITATGFTGPGGGLTGVNAANLGGQAASAYALLSGATFTGTVDAAVVQVNGSPVWHPGNDGSGSGLDADTLDGKQANGFADANHVYHTLVSNSYYYDDYNQRNNLRWVGENALSDLYEQRQIEQVEYHDGTNWVSWAAGEALVQLMLDGNESTIAAIPRANRRFRFKVSASSGWPTYTFLVLQTTWSSVAYPSTNLIVSDSTSLNGTYTERVNLTFDASNTGSNWGIHGYYTNAFHNGTTWNWIEIDITDWGSDTDHYDIKGLNCFSNFSGTTKGTFYVDYGRKTTFRGEIEAPLMAVNGATTDTTNRLAVRSPASLFDNIGSGGHQVKINKKADGDTAGFLFQRDYSGRAEFGLLGDNSFRLKVSNDGSTWYDALEVSPTTGSAKFVQPPELPQYSRTSLPSTSVSARIIYVYDATGGAGPAYCDGGSWKMMRDDGAP